MPRAYVRRQTRNTPGFVQPPMDPVRQPDPVERTQPNPRLYEPPPEAGLYKLQPATGPFALQPPDPKAVRAVTEGDLEDLLEWAFPRYAERHPHATREGMLPFLRVACQGLPFKFLRTDDACGIFQFGRYPWEPQGVVVDLLVVDREGSNASFEAVKIYRAGLEWAKQLNAREFRFAEDNTGMDLSPLAKRIGCDRECRQYIKTLHA